MLAAAPVNSTVVLYTIPDQYRCVPEIVAGRGSVYTQDACTVAFYATERQRDAPVFEVVQLASHDFCKTPHCQCKLLRSSSDVELAEPNANELKQRT